MKKVLAVLFIILVLGSSVFAGQVLGTNQNLEMEADFAYILTTGQKARTDKERNTGDANDTYFVNAIGFKLGAIYDNNRYPLDFYADLAFAFPSKYNLVDVSEKTNKTLYKQDNYDDFYQKGYKSINTTWNMFNLDAGILMDLNVLPSTSLFKLRAGCGIAFNSFNLSNKGKDDNATTQAEIEHFKNLGLSLKGTATYNFMGNFYVNASVTPSFNILSSYYKKIKNGSAILTGTTDNTLQFALGFNLMASIGLTCNI